MYYCEVSSPQIAYVYDADKNRKIVGIFSAYDAKKVVVLLNAERNRKSSQKLKAPIAKPKVEKPKTPIFRYPRRLYKQAYRDVACRYLKRFGGRTFKEQTAIDDIEIYLVNRNDEVIAKVSSFDLFPKPVEPRVYDDIPY